jgi:hypothetical protein
MQRLSGRIFLMQQKISLKARGGGDAGTSLTTSNSEIARNTYAPNLLNI